MLLLFTDNYFYWVLRSHKLISMAYELPECFYLPWEYQNNLTTDKT